MQSQGIMPSVVEDAIKHGTKSKGNKPGTTVHYSKTNDVKVVTNADGKVVTVNHESS